MRRRVTIPFQMTSISYIKEMAGQRNMSMSAWLEQMLIKDLPAKAIDLGKPDQGCKSKAAEA